jgi:HAD superfamily hydrolase (TIGR01450 family)
MKFINSFSELAEVQKYDTIACDIYGVLHDGYEPYPYTLQTLQHLESRNQVVLLSNSSRMYPALSHQLSSTFNIAPAAYNDILSSGKLTRLFLEDCQRYLEGQATATQLGAQDFCAQQEWTTKRVVRFFIAGGLDYLGPLYHGLDCFEPTEDWDAMAFVLLGSIKPLYGTDKVDPFDETSVIAHYRPFLEKCLARKVPVICTNPDVWAPSGINPIDGSQRLLICPGYVGEMYKAMGGQVLYFGKPYKTIYDYLGKSSGGRKILCVGDNVATDVLGANDSGLDVVLILGGVHAKQFPNLHDLHTVFAQVRQLCQEAGTQEPTYVMPYLRWN